MGEHIRPVSPLLGVPVGEGDNVAAQGRGDAARGQMEGSGQMTGDRSDNPSYAHRLSAAQLIPDCARQRIKARQARCGAVALAVEATAIHLASHELLSW
ncbi:TPA: hypothetical protein QDC22_004684 [Burkholderia stabilis]|nr:hypothetical protein [Burkholderia stabilis]HDR9650803.1 hypothetical protein [Burkholderia stabilis]HDR9656027.1 hypothetical protein [Burkholderia stabilis]HDR9681112.1 hypothetical protein [Burkholderia stabilis]